MHFVPHTHTHTALLAARTLQVSPCPLLINNITSGRDLRLMRPHACSQHVCCVHVHTSTHTSVNPYRHAHTETLAQKHTAGLQTQYALSPWEGPRYNHNSLLPSLRLADLCFKWAAGNWRGGCPSAATSACAVGVISIYYILHAPWV